ncbi:TPA: hypothetical protein ACFP41_001210 [Neisseria weaveri]
MNLDELIESLKVAYLRLVSEFGGSHVGRYYVPYDLLKTKLGYQRATKKMLETSMLILKQAGFEVSDEPANKALLVKVDINSLSYQDSDRLADALEQYRNRSHS